MDDVSDVDIDVGRFKYVLIAVTDPKTRVTKHIVRGYIRCHFHGDIVDEVEPQLNRLKLTYDCVGGGRIVHNVEEKTILIFGYSQGFGKADHSIASKILKEHYKDYESITWSDEGY
ncbi:unnamed protein product [Medioppia subpectinata]|uniref:14 kDa phosphohistidine phosphatase n=1 Tax=Medioppia subpectinata TaxID=1979941 RepID=A0A7R9PXY6_9ACAR|nr:unnamed protein product [Medioppia subpectinata]CAG2105316.1 unnamed protein product [Medioppia subpectinata]